VPSPRSVLVVGATGFVGRHLVPSLRRAGYDVRAASRGGGGEGGVALDVTDADSVRRAFDAAPPNAVVHLAAIAHRPTGVSAAEHDAVNHQGTRAVLAAAREAGVSRFVFFSSASVYGDVGRRGPVAEDAELRPQGAYAASKSAAEAAALAEGAVALRLPAIYAPDWLLDVRKRAYVPGLGGRMLLSVPGARQPHYSLCAVEHAADAVMLALDGRLGPGAVNVADPEPYSQAHVARVVGQVDGVYRRLSIPRALVRAAVAPASFLPGNAAAGAVNSYWKLFEGLVLDTGRLRAAGFRPRMVLDDVVKPAREAPPPA
jgi:nucleoside-diphosphate-sugar epimerase